MNFEKHMALLKRRQRGELSGAEQEALNNYEQTDEGRSNRRLWDASSSYKQRFEPDPDAALARFRQRLAKEEGGVKLRAVSRRRFYWAAAASVAILIVAGIAFLGGDKKIKEERLIAAGEIVEATLADGSKVILNEGAELIYPSAFDNATERRVQLVGEAYFSISHNPDQPFVIATKMTEVEVLGTAFNLRALPEEDFTEVEVAEGKVALKEMESGEHIILTPKKCGSFHPGMGFKKEDAPMLNRLAWQRNKLQFVNTPLSKVLPMMERFYDIEISGKEQLTDLACPISGNWTHNDLPDLMDVITALTTLEMEKTARGKFLLKGEGC